jgi:DNA-directed RNA polymerase subunit beta
MASYARINKFGFLETPYQKVKDGKVSREIVYLDASQEEEAAIAHASAPLDKDNKFINKEAQARIKGRPGVISADKIDYMDVSPNQAVSIATSLIPFLEHDDAHRALMGSNMQRQAVSCVKPQSPVVGTGMEKEAAADSGQVVIAKEDGEVMEVDAKCIRIANHGGREMYQNSESRITNHE